MATMETEIYSNGLDPAQLTAFITDLILLTTFAERKKVSKDTVYNAIKKERIQESDLIWIDKYQFIRWSQYKHLTFRDKVINKRNPNRS